jgi:cytochrome c biogenesis protein CcmG/thiol:disulfide interchange protein DsbE
VSETPSAPAPRGLKITSLLPLIVAGLIVAVAGFVLVQGGARRDLESAGLRGAPVPAYDLPALDPAAPRTTAAAFAGRPYVINVFASWCAPCRVEHPLLAALAEEGAPILGIAYKDTPLRTQAFLAELGNPFTAVGQDPDGRYGLEIGVTGVPETFVVDGAGVIRLIHRGPLTPEIVAREIRPALAAAGRP